MPYVHTSAPGGTITAPAISSFKIAALAVAPPEVVRTVDSHDPVIRRPSGVFAIVFDPVPAFATELVADPIRLFAIVIDVVSVNATGKLLCSTKNHIDVYRSECNWSHPNSGIQKNQIFIRS